MIFENTFEMLRARKKAINEEIKITAVIIFKSERLNFARISAIATAEPVLDFSITYSVVNDRLRTRRFTLPRSMRNLLLFCCCFSFSSDWRFLPIIAA